jgi:phospholipid/cholesterol/gamma-HCH transport system substrate-binding protein
LRQLNPPLQGLAAYKNELSAFFPNAAASTQATTREGNTRVHYLRTTNPTNPENLAFRGLASGLPSYETRQCDFGPVPTLGSNPALIPPALEANVQTYFFNAPPGTKTAAPACKQQGAFPFGGEVTQFPHVNPATGP